MMLLQRQRQSWITPTSVLKQESNAVSAAQRCAEDAHERLRSALADDDEIQRVTNELRELRSHKSFEYVLICTPKDDL